MSSQRQNSALVALGDAVRRIRANQDISQERLALLAEIDRSYMGRVERGDNNVAVLTLLKISTALGVTMTELMAEAGL